MTLLCVLRLFTIYPIKGALSWDGSKIIVGRINNMDKRPISLKWMRISRQIRERLLCNIFCINCGDAVKAVNYYVEEEIRGLIIHGKCADCGADVKRIVGNE